MNPDIEEMLDAAPSEILLSATTGTLRIKTSRSYTGGILSMREVEDQFHTKVLRAYELENIILKHMPLLCKDYNDVVNYVPKSDQEEWELKSNGAGYECVFNLLFRAYSTYKVSRVKKTRLMKRGMLISLISLDDVNLWEEHRAAGIYTVGAMDEWYRKKIQPIEAVLIKPEVEAEFP